MAEYIPNTNNNNSTAGSPGIPNDAQRQELPLAVDPPSNGQPVQTNNTGINHSGAVHYAAPQVAAPHKEFVTFEGVDRIDGDIDLWFKLRGHSVNPLADVAMPLFGMVIQARKLSYHPQIPQLYVRVRDEIAALLEEIKQHGYDGPAQLAYCYCLCSFYTFRMVMGDFCTFSGFIQHVIQRRKCKTHGTDPHCRTVSPAIVGGTIRGQHPSIEIATIICMRKFLSECFQ